MNHGIHRWMAVVSRLFFGVVLCLDIGSDEIIMVSAPKGADKEVNADQR